MPEKPVIEYVKFFFPDGATAAYNLGEVADGNWNLMLASIEEVTLITIKLTWSDNNPLGTRQTRVMQYCGVPYYTQWKT